MSQNDMSIANASGATVRADINSALQALASQNSGSSAPSTTYANQWWHDDTNDIMKIRDEANANWINAFSKVGTTWIPYSNGSVLGTMANLNYASIVQHLTMGADKALAFDETSVSSGTPNFASSGNVVILSGTATADTLGTVQAGFIGIIYYGIAITLTHNATSRKLCNNGNNIDTAVGDFEVVLSRGSGNWYTILYMRADGTALVGSSASQAQQEAAASTSVFVTPGRQHFHPGHPKAWVNYKMTTTSSITSDYGITSRTDDGTGLATFTFDTAFSSTTYTCGGGWARDTSTDSIINSGTSAGAKTTTTFQVECTSYSGGDADSPEVGNTWVGDQ